MKITSEQIEAMAQEHINRFRSMVSLARSGQKGYRLSECQMYLDIWERTIFAVRNKNPLPEDGKSEIFDAISSGEYWPNLFQDQEIEFP